MEMNIMISRIDTGTMKQLMNCSDEFNNSMLEQEKSSFIHTNLKIHQISGMTLSFLAFVPLICYTCVNVSNNFICNQYAVDVPCPKGNDFCYTLHIMDSTGASVIVNKKCANSSECWESGVGCLKVDSQTICVSCCDELYCNITVPTNQSDATLSNKRASNKNKSTFAMSSGFGQLLGNIYPLAAGLMLFFKNMNGG